MNWSILLVTAVAAVVAVPQPEGVQLWQDYKAQFCKSYDPSEEQQKMKVFLENLKDIEEHNAKYDAGVVSHKKGVDRFSDLTMEEFLEEVGCFYVNTTVASQRMFVPSPGVSYPPSIDWRARGAVTPVKDQQQCGSCWSFSTTGALETQLYKKTGKLVSLSEQNLLDCCPNGGCEKGGSYVTAFQCIKEKGGIDTEESYPYEQRIATCRYNPSKSAGTDNGLVRIQSGDEEGLKAAVATVGPVSVAINAKYFRGYKGGIIDDPHCENTMLNLNHAVLVVGYGTSESGQDYWIVRNSWGIYWGQEGYALMARNKNQCGIALDAAYPTV